MGALVLDASALVAFLDSDDAHFSSASKAIRLALDQHRLLILPASAYAEVMVRPMKAGKAEDVDSFIDATGIEIVDLDRRGAGLAAELRARHRSLRLGDALVLATAQMLDADLLTFDKSLGRLARR